MVKLFRVSRFERSLLTRQTPASMVARWVVLKIQSPRAVLGLLLGIVLCTAPAGAHAQSRTLELISPPSKNNASILGSMVIDSDHAAVKSSGSIFDSDPFSTGAGEYVASRHAGVGWALSFSPIESRAALVDFLSWDDRVFESFIPLLPGEVDDGSTDVYRWDAGSLTLESTGSVGGSGVFEAKYLTSAGSGGHLLFRTPEPLDPRDSGRAPFTSMLYERVGGETRAVALDSAGQIVSSGGAILAGDGRGALSAFGEGGLAYPISEDGSRIFFESPAPSAGGDTQLYVREGGATTTLVSGSRRTTPGNGPRSVRFEGAAADGSRVLFRTAAQLTDDDQDDYVDLYLYDLDADALTRVSAGQAGAENGTCEADVDNGLHGVCGIVALSQDARRIYYLSTGAVGDEGVAGDFNVYLYDAQAAETQTVLSAPGAPAGSQDEEVRSLYQGGRARISIKAEASTDGSILAFAADTPLTGFDNVSPACVSANQSRCTEIYRYEADGDELACVSCNEAHVPPLGPAELPVGGFPPAPPRRFLASDGSTLVFESADALVPADVDGQVDVYEWRDGHVSLVSSGTGEQRSKLVGIGPDGADVLFLTAAPLLPQDTDTLTDLYDARIGGGLPGPPPPPAQCVGDECQGERQAPPALQPPGVVADATDGNVVPGPPAKVALLRVGHLDRSARRVRIRLRASAAGRVSATITARIAGRVRTIGQATKRISRAGTVELPVPLKRSAQRELRRRALRATVVMQLSGAPRWARRSVVLRRAPRR